MTKISAITTGVPDLWGETMSITLVSWHTRQLRALLTTGLAGLLMLLGAGTALAQNAYVPN